MLSRSLHQNRALLELSRLVAAGEHGLWTGALSILLGPSGAPWGVAYRLVGATLELAASEALPVGLRGQVETFDLARDGAFAACRAVRSKRGVSDDRLFAGVIDPRASAHLEAAAISAGIAVPVVYGGAALGALLLGAPARDGFEHDALAFVEAAASFLAPAAALLEAKRPSSSDRHISFAPRRDSPPPLSRRTADLSRAALDAIQQMGPLLRRTVTDIRTAVDDECVAFGDPGDLRIAVVHLVANAVEAAAERAPPASAPSSPRRVRVNVRREGATAVVCVEDSGRGVSPDLRSRVFEAGFTTKGKGRGNGLYLVRQIAREHGGHVEVGASELGGAAFRLLLPASVTRPEAWSGGGPPRRGESATLPRFRAPAERSGLGGDDDEDPEKTLSVPRTAVS